MTYLVELNQSITQALSMADVALPSMLFNSVLLPDSEHDVHGRFVGFTALISKEGIKDEAIASFHMLLSKMAQIQSECKATQARIETLEHMKGHSAQLQKANEKLLELKSLQKAIDAVCFKHQGYLKRFFGNETWEQWAIARTDLGQLVVLASDYLYGGLSEIRVASRLNKLNLDQALVEMNSVLSDLKSFSSSEEPLQSLVEPRQLSAPSEAASFVAAFGGDNTDEGWFIKETSDSGFILSGYTVSFGAGDADVLVAKLDGAGELLWAHAYGGSSYEVGYALQETTDGGFVLSGWTKSFGAGNNDVLVAKLDGAGELLWAHTFGESSDDAGFVVQAAADGGFVISGYATSFGSGGRDVLVAKFDGTGELLWAHTFGESSYDEEGWSIQATVNGGFVLLGYTQSFGAGGDDALVVKLDNTGKMLWAHAIGGSSDDHGYAIQATADGGFVFSGYTNSFGAGSNDVLVAKLDGSGALSWAHTFGGGGNDYGLAIQTTDDGGFVFSGYTASFGAGDADVLIAKLDYTGELQWAHTFGGSSDDRSYTLQVTADSGFLLSGWTKILGAGNLDVLVAKLNTSGWAENCSHILDITQNITFTNITADLANEAITPSWLNITDTISVADAALVQTNITDSLQQELTCQATYAVAEAALTTAAPVEPTTAASLETTLQPATTTLATTNQAASFLSVFGESGSETGYALQITDDGGFVLTGYMTSLGAGGADVLVAKVDWSGELTWAYALGGVSNDFGESIQVAADGSIILTGYTKSFGAGNEDGFIAKLDDLGRVQWARAWGGISNDRGQAIQSTVDGNFILAGTTKNFGAGINDVYVEKVDSDGDLLWAHAMGGIVDDSSKAIQITSDGGLILVGYTSSFGSGNWDVLVTKLNDVGELNWARVLGESNVDQGYDIQETTDGCFVFTGYTQSFGVESADVLVAKMDSSGELLWAHALGGSDTDYGYAIQGTHNGGVILSGYTSSFGAGGQDVLVAMLNNVGELLWAHTIGQSGADFGYSIQVTADGNFVISGYTQSFGAGSNDVLVARLNASGWAENCSHILDITQNITFTNITDDIINEAITLSWLNITDSIGVADAALVQTNITGSLQEELVCQATYTVVEDVPTATTALPVEPTTAAPALETTLQPATTALATTREAASFLAFLGGSGSDYSYGIQETADGGFILSGQTSSFGAGGSDVLVAKLDVVGELLWAYALGGSLNDYGYTIKETTDAGFVLLGATLNFGAGDYDVLVVKLNHVGDLCWAHVFGGSSVDHGNALQVTADDGFVLAGSIYSFGAGNYDVLVAKLDYAGGLLWAHTFGGSSGDVSWSIQETADGGLVLAGYTQSFGSGEYDAFVVKLDRAGGLLWARALGGSNRDYGYAIKATADGGFVLLGHTSSFGAGGYDVLVVKLDHTGELSWAYTFGGISSDEGHALQETADGGLVLTGYTQSFGVGNYDALVAKLSYAGELLWAHAFGGSNGDYGYAISETADGGILLSGYSESFGAGDNDVLVVKLNASGWVENCSYIMDITANITFTNITDDIANEDITPSWLNITDTISVADAALVQTNITDSLQKELTCQATFVVEEVSSATTTLPIEPTTAAPTNQKPGIPGNQLTSPIVNLKDGGYAIMGIDNNVTDGIPKFEFLRMNETGGTDWIWQWLLDSTGYDKMVTSVETSDGGMALLGITGRYGAGDYDILVVKLNATGYLEWSNTLGGNHSDISHSIQETVAGDLVITGRTHSLQGDGWDVLVAKLNATGGLKWVYSVGGSKEDVGRSVQVTLEDDVLIAGHSKSYGQGGSDMLLLHLNATGHMNRSWVFGTAKHEHGYTVEGLADGGIALGGYTNGFGSGGGYDALVAKLNAGGDLDWYGALGGMGDDMAFTMIEDDDGVLSLDGLSDANSNSRDRMQAVLEADGTITYCSAAFIDTPAALNTSASFVVEVIEPSQHDLSNVMQVQSASINASHVNRSFLESVVNFRTCVVEAASNASRRALETLSKKKPESIVGHTPADRGHLPIDSSELKTKASVDYKNATYLFSKII